MVGYAAEANGYRSGAGVPRWAGVLLGVFVLVGLNSHVAQAKGKKERERDARIAIIRALGQEIAVAKIELPRGKNGVFVDAKGQMDQAKATTEMRHNGLALRPGTLVQITKIEFKSDQVKIELNGGGKKQKKWYERIEIGGMGGTSAPIATTDTTATGYGSSVTVAFPGKLETVTPEQVKKLLDSVLDFERRSPTVLYSPEVPPEIKEAIKNHQVIVGMDRDAVLSSKGPPDRKVRETRDGVEEEDWIYGLPPHVLFVTFDGESVVHVKQF